jgi:aspartate racemase
VYADVLERSGLETIIPSEAVQKDVMEAIYGKAGIKAGNTEGPPRQLLKHAAENLVAQGAGLIILGCTEIPLALKPEDAAVPLIDATQILADSAVRELARLSGNN